MAKRKGVSGLETVELSMALESVKKWRVKLGDEPDVPSGATDIEREFTDVDAVDAFISFMESRLNAAKSLGFPAVNNDPLARIGIEDCGTLLWKGSLVVEQKCKQAREKAAEHVMSASNLYATLNFLLRHTLSDSEPLARLWIDSFLYRVTAMMGDTRRLIIVAEVFAEPETVATSRPTVYPGGHVDYVLFSVEERLAGAVLDARSLAGAIKRVKQSKLHGLFVAEAQCQSEDLSLHVPQAVAEMQASAKRLQSRYIRGAVTNGKAWIFLFLELNDDLLGGRYWSSERFTIGMTNTTANGITTTHVEERDIDLIIAVLADWTTHCAEDLAQDDWFEFS